MILAAPPAWSFLLGQAVVFAVPTVAILAAAGWYTAYSLSQRSFANKLAAGDPDDLATSGGDEVLLEGTARPTDTDGTIEAPATGEECLAHEFTVERRSPDGGPDDHGPSWGREAVGGRSVPFLLDAGEGTVLVEPAAGVGKLKEQTNLEIYGNETTVEFDPEDRPERVDRLFERWDQVHEGTERKRRIEERSLRPGETAVVSGVLKPPHEVDRVVPRAATYVVGPRERADDSGGLSLPSYPTFKVGDDTMEDLASELHRGARWGLGIGAVGLSLGLVGLGALLTAVAPVVSYLL